MAHEGWNPRYVAFATAHGRTPEEQAKYDVEHWPGGRNCGFMLWISARWSEWRKLRGRKTYDIVSLEDHADFNAMIRAGSLTLTQA